MRVRWEEIQAANDLTDGAVGAAKDALAAATAEAQVLLDGGDQTAQTITTSASWRPGRGHGPQPRDRPVHHPAGAAR